MKLFPKDPAELRLHPLQKHLPAPVADSAEWHSFVDNLSGAGPEGIPPIVITPDGFIMDGGRRWRAAKQLAWNTIVCVEQPEERAAALIVESLMGQRKMTRGAAVYLALGVMKEFVQAAETRRLQNLKRAVKTHETPLKVPNPNDSDSGTIQSLCQRLGVGWDLFNAAREVHKIFAQDAEFKAEWEPKLLAGEKSLWNVRSAHAGAQGDQGTRDSSKTVRQLELFADTAADLYARCKGAEQKRHVAQMVGKAITKLPMDLIVEIAAVIQQRIHEEGGK